MITNIRTTLLIVLIGLAGVGLPIARAADGPPAPLGFAIGQARFDTVKAALSKKTTVKETGINRYSRGPILQADGHGLGLENLREVTLAFDRNKRLAALLMVFDKKAMDANFDPLYRQLASKYRVVQKQIPFVGNKFVRFEQGDVLIELISPHLGWDINLIYKTREFDQAARTQQQKDQKQKSDNERQQL